MRSSGLVASAPVAGRDPPCSGKAQASIRSALAGLGCASTGVRVWRSLRCARAAGERSRAIEKIGEAQAYGGISQSANERPTGRPWIDPLQPQPKLIPNQPWIDPASAPERRKVHPHLGPDQPRICPNFDSGRRRSTAHRPRTGPKSA